MLNIKNARKAKKLSQAVVAELLDVTQATFSGWETGKYEIDNNSLIKLSDILDTTTDYLLGKTDTPHIINHINVLSPIFDKYNKLNLLDQKKVDTYIDDLLENRKYTDKIVEINQTTSEGNDNLQNEKLIAYGGKIKETQPPIEKKTNI